VSPGQQECLKSNNRILDKKCFTNLAKNRNDQQYCFNLDDSCDIGYCIRRLAIENRDPHICNTIQDIGTCRHERSKNEFLSNCKTGVPLSFNKNQSGRTIFIFLAPILVLIFTLILLFKSIPGKFKIKLSIITIVYFGGYIFWVYKMINYVGTDLIRQVDISNVLFRIFFPIFWPFSLLSSLLSDVYFIYFTYALIQFLILFILFFGLSYYFHKNEISASKRRGIVIGIIAYVILSIFVNLLPYLGGGY